MPPGVFLTRSFAVAVFLVCVAFDVWVIHRYDKSASISVVLHEWACDAPIVAGIAFGVLFHIFWPHR